MGAFTRAVLTVPAFFDTPRRQAIDSIGAVFSQLLRRRLMLCNAFGREASHDDSS